MFLATYLAMQCSHVRPSHSFALLYCFFLSIVFVGSLYVLIPRAIRKLNRDDVQNIQWRCLAVAASCAISMGSYGFLFCSSIAEDSSSSTSLWRILGWTNDSWRVIAGALVHVSLLYLGPIVVSILQVGEGRSRLSRAGEKVSYLRAFRLVVIDPILSPLVEHEDERWCQCRNLLVAPFTEEIVFRGCMVPALLSARLKPLFVAFVAPLFFGTAHVHHALTKVGEGHRLRFVVISTVFQFAYTFLFGSYAAYAFIRTGSIISVSLCHSYCNFMGLPDLGFFDSNGNRLSRLYCYRWHLLATYLVGVGGFVWGIRSDRLLPGHPILLDTLSGALS